jgi:hypothetical protein
MTREATPKAVHWCQRRDFGRHRRWRRNRVYIADRSSDQNQLLYPGSIRLPTRNILPANIIAQLGCKVR